MSLSNKRELSLLKHDEAEVVRTTHYPAIQELDRKAIAEARRKLTTLRDTEKTFARQKAREAALTVENATAVQLREGSEATLRQLLSALERNKVVPIAPAQGERFDPNVHQAISVAPAPEGAELAPNSVVNVLQKGYRIADRVLRPALVTVTAAQ